MKKMLFGLLLAATLSVGVKADINLHSSSTPSVIYVKSVWSQNPTLEGTSQHIEGPWTWSAKFVKSSTTGVVTVSLLLSYKGSETYSQSFTLNPGPSEDRHTAIIKDATGTGYTTVTGFVLWNSQGLPLFSFSATHTGGGPRPG